MRNSSLNQSNIETHPNNNKSARYKPCNDIKRDSLGTNKALLQMRPQKRKVQMNLHQQITAGVILFASVLLLLDPVRFAGPIAWLLAGYSIGLLHILEKLWQMNKKIRS